MASVACTNTCWSDDEKRLEVLLAAAASVTDEGVDSLQFGTRGRRQRVCREVGSKGNQAEAALTRLTDGFISVFAAGVRNSVEQLCGSPAVILPGSRGERGRRRWGIGGRQCRMSLGSGSERGKGDRGAVVSAGENRRRLEMTLTGGSHLSVEEKQK
jgi:hypothetical protein